MSPSIPFPFMLVIIIFFFLVIGGLFPMTSAFCGNDVLGCSTGVTFGYPFSYVLDADVCGYPGLTFHCSDNEIRRPMVNISNHLYYILNHEERTQVLRVVGMDADQEACFRPTQNFTLQTTSPFLSPYGYNDVVTYFYNCSSGYPKDVVQHLPCLDAYYNNTTTPGLRSFAFSGNHIRRDGYNWYANCQKTVAVPIFTIANASDYTQSLKLGFDLRWSPPGGCMTCENSGGQCWYNQSGQFCSCQNNTKLFDQVCPIRHKAMPTKQKIMIIGVCSGVGVLLLLIIFVFGWKNFSVIASHWKYKIKTLTNVEAFLESCGCIGLQRYTYPEIQKMTNSFKEKLGEGGFGSVFKGKLGDGRLVAVKVLNESRGNGEDFINEVATIGRTNHLNVVSLVGFCSNGRKRALVYEFMVNGSLEKFIYHTENPSTTTPPLGWEKLYQIALGIAKGLEYLHYGCNIRILHFDIKPHNILLDEDFRPKISDFGSAKLCQTRKSIVSMHAARGTIGYIAPEVYCRNFGGVSSKSDVYSYGMMIFEMIGCRNNIDPTVENTSEVYFPQWIYNHINQGIDLDGTEDLYTEESTKKMIIVAFWCVQTQPSDRPSINKVVEMLEGSLDELQMPPDPFQSYPSISCP